MRSVSSRRAGLRLFLHVLRSPIADGTRFAAFYPRCALHGLRVAGPAWGDDNVEVHANVNGNGRKIAALCLLLIVGGGWVGLASRYTGRMNQVQAATDANALAIDSNSPAVTSLGLDGGGMVLRMTIAIVIVVGLGVAALYMSRRILPRAGQSTNREIRVVETTYLGPRKTLHLVEVAGQRLLIASTPDRITMLAPLGDPWLDGSKPGADDAVES